MVWLVVRGIGWQVISAISCAPPERHVPLKAQPANEAGKAEVWLRSSLVCFLQLHHPSFNLPTHFRLTANQSDSRNVLAPISATPESLRQIPAKGHPAPRMTLCKFFLQGNCRFGSE